MSERIRYIINGEPHVAEVYNRPIRDLANSLGNSYTLNVGTTAGTVAAGDDPRILAAATKQYTDIELNKKADKTVMNLELNKKADKTAMAAALDSKVDKKPAHSLYPDEDKAKLATMNSGATKNRSDQDTDNLLDLKLDKVTASYVVDADKVPMADGSKQIAAEWVKGSIINQTLPDLSMKDYRTTYPYNGVAATLVSAGTPQRPTDGTTWYVHQYHSGNKTTQLLIPYSVTDGIKYRVIDENGESEWVEVYDSRNLYNLGSTIGEIRSKMGLGSSSYRNVGTTAGTVAAGDDPRFNNIGGGSSTIYNVNTTGDLTGGGRLDRNLTLNVNRASMQTYGTTKLATDLEGRNKTNRTVAQTPSGTWAMIKDVFRGTYSTQGGHISLPDDSSGLKMMWTNTDFRMGTGTYTGYFPIVRPPGFTTYASFATIRVDNAVTVDGKYNENVIMTVINQYSFRIHVTCDNGQGVCNSLFIFG